MTDRPTVRRPDGGSPPSTVQDESARPRILDWEKEFMSAKVPEAIVEDLIFEGSTHFLNGVSKGGKSVAMNQLGLCIAAGAPFLEQRAKRRRVLLLSLEMSAGLVRDRLQAIARDVGIPEPDPKWFKVVAPMPGYSPRIDLTHDAGAAEVERLIEEADAQLVIFDTLYRFIGGLDPSDNGEMGHVMGRLNGMASRTGAALVVIHHTKKGTFDGETSQSGLGASIFGGASNVVVHLTRGREEGQPRWTLDVASHYALWEEEIHYVRPERSDGSPGMGCVRTTATGARALTRERIEQVFREGGEAVRCPDAEEPEAFVFHSKNAFAERLRQTGLARSESAAKRLVSDITDDFQYPAGPLIVASGAEGRNANLYGWCVAPGKTLTVSGQQIDVVPLQAGL